MNSLHHNIKAIKAVNPATITATANGLTVDTLGYTQVEFVVSIGAVGAADGSNYLTFTIEESDTDFSGAAITDANRIFGTVLVINATTQANSVAQFGIRKTEKRYVRLVYTETGTFSGLFGAVAILGQPLHAPANS